MRRLSRLIERVEEKHAAAVIRDEAEAVRHRGLLRARVKVGAIIRARLESCRLDPACATQLRLIDEAEAALSAVPDTSELQQMDAESEALLFPQRDVQAAVEALSAKMAAMAGRCSRTENPEFASASLAELFLWSIGHRDS